MEPITKKKLALSFIGGKFVILMYEEKVFIDSLFAVWKFI